VIVQITISVGRTLGQKRALFRRIADNLAALGLRREDVWINLIEVPKENWSCAHVDNAGIASYAPAAAQAA
jgi:phenylpyruvate tautomerase PptA (4-oxalocrotonate tautomerase family)